MTKKKNDKNYLDTIPKINPKINYESDDKNIVTLELKNKGFFNRFAQKFFKRPKITFVHLDELSSFIWLNIDGQKSIYGIAGLVKENFGDKAEPLYPRLIQHFRSMENFGFIKRL